MELIHPGSAKEHD